MRIAICLLLVLFVVGCATPEQQLTQVEKDLKERRAELQQVKDDLENIQSELRSAKNIVAEADGKEFILRLRSKKERISFDLESQAKDSLNAVEFEIPVTRGFYEAHRVGESLSGSWGGVTIKVIKKYIR